jgi:methylthioribose-1-phosphate isomerase
MIMSQFKSIEFTNGKFRFLDQTKLPLKEVYHETDDYERIALAIERLEVRGAPQIGITAAFALALGMKFVYDNHKKNFDKIHKRLAGTRPTAVNLFWALDELKKVFSSVKNYENIYGKLLTRAKEIHHDDILKCNKIGENGLAIFQKESVVLTHCNTGRLATGGEGTAFSVIKTGFEKGKVIFVYADETRPLLQGSRLTAFELSKNGIPFKINTDSTAAMLMQQNKIDIVVTGADRIAKNGDSANKIGTYNLAVLCKHHNIPFYIAAPTSTIDKDCKHGDQIKIEERNKSEVINVSSVQITKEEYDVYSPAFDVTPHELITGIITEEKLHKPPYNF